MIRKFAVLAIAVAAVGFVVSSAEAGGTSGAKKSSTIRMKNYSPALGDDVVAVLIPNGTAFPTTPAAAQALGSKPIGAQGKVNAFPVAPGIGNASAVYVLDLPAAPNLPFVAGTVAAPVAYNVVKAGLIGYMGINGASGAAPVIVTGPAAGGPF